MSDTQNPTQNVTPAKEVESRVGWPIDGNTIDMKYLRATDLPSNKRVFLPPPVTMREEMKLQNLKHDLIGATREYIHEHKRDPDNLTKEEKEGLDTLKKKKEIVVYQTDKSARFAVDSKENYKVALAKHTEADEDASEEQHRKAQKVINAHSTFWTRINKAGNQELNQNMTTACSLKIVDLPLCMHLEKTTSHLVMRERALP